MDRARRGWKDWYCSQSASVLWHLLTIPTGTIGITEYASEALGEVVYVELPELDMEVNKGDSIGAVESVKSASDIMTPVPGKIVQANSLLQQKPGTINNSPKNQG